MIIKCPLIPRGWCVNLFGTIWTRDPAWIDKYVINHERIHTAQQRELLFLPFYVIYVLEWLFRLISLRSFKAAYSNISFEREAYANGHNLSYLPGRPRYAWLRYLKKT